MRVSEVHRSCRRALISAKELGRCQLSFADAEYADNTKKTRREVFLDELELVVPLKVLLKIIELHYGCRPWPQESMLRVHLMQA